MRALASADRRGVLSRAVLIRSRRDLRPPSSVPRRTFARALPGNWESLGGHAAAQGRLQDAMEIEERCDVIGGTACCKCGCAQWLQRGIRRN